MTFSESPDSLFSPSFTNQPVDNLRTSLDSLPHSPTDGGFDNSINSPGGRSFPSHTPRSDIRQYQDSNRLPSLSHAAILDSEESEFDEVKEDEEESNSDHEDGLFDPETEPEDDVDNGSFGDQTSVELGSDAHLWKIDHSRGEHRLRRR